MSWATVGEHGSDLHMFEDMLGRDTTPRLPAFADLQDAAAAMYWLRHDFQFEDMYTLDTTGGFE